MQTSARAAVRPRVLELDSGEQFLLEDEVRRLVETRQRGVVQLYGGPGSGKSTALAHLAAVLGNHRDVTFVDDADFDPARAWSQDQLVICATARAVLPTPRFSWKLIDWSADELIEYLLTTRKPACGAVMARLSPAARAQFPGKPEIWHIILDEMIADPQLSKPSEAILRFVERTLSNVAELGLVGDACLQLLTADQAVPSIRVQESRFSPVVGALVRHRDIQMLLAARELALQVREGTASRYLRLALPRKLIETTAARLENDQEAIEELITAIVERPMLQAMSVSLLLAMGIDWTPAAYRRYDLGGAFLNGVHWPGMALKLADVEAADLRGANLSRAVLDNARAADADFSGAKLSRASLAAFIGDRARFVQADLSSIDAPKASFDSGDLRGARLNSARLQSASFAATDLSHVSFRGASLPHARFTAAILEEADFSGADLEGADLAGLDLRSVIFEGTRLMRANLFRCNLEEMVLDALDFSDANLEESLLTGASLKGGKFQRASLRAAGLAEIDAEGADFQGADFRDSTFHLGSSRNGLIFSPIASEGSRTGFYTDDFHEQAFKAPEEIRKANLCGADLRGANVEGTDFYLVDLRRARYDAVQEQHFRRCRAILDDLGVD